MSAHVVVQDAAEGMRVLREVRVLVKERFGIDHITVQVEDEGLAGDRIRDAGMTVRPTARAGWAA